MTILDTHRCSVSGSLLLGYCWRGISQTARLVTVGLVRVEKARDRLAHSLPIARRTIARDMVLESIGLKCLLAYNRERAVIGIVGVVKEHPNSAT